MLSPVSSVVSWSRVISTTPQGAGVWGARLMGFRDISALWGPPPLQSVSVNVQDAEYLFCLLHMCGLCWLAHVNEPPLYIDCRSYSHEGTLREAQ